MRTGPVESGTVRDIRNLITITNLDYFLDLFCRPGQDHSARDLGHYPLIPQTTFISSRSTPVTLTDRRIIGNILRTHDRFHYLENFFRDSHHFPPWT
jgi:hypothetical protein